jgi:hypothetical protein
MLPKCRHVAEQLSEDFDEPITGFKRFKLKLHLLICVYCRRYGKQIQLSSNTVKLIEKDAKPKPSDALKETMLARFRKSCSDRKK